MDTARIARLRDVLAGGNRGQGRDWDMAGEIEKAWPGTGELALRAREYHRRMAARAVTGVTACAPARSVIFTASGLPPRDGPLHAKAARLAPGARFAYVHGNRTAALIARVALELPDPGHVTVIEPEVEDPGAWLGTAGARELLALGPASVHVVLAAHRWPGWLAAEVLTAYRRELPSGSSVCMTLGTASGPRAAEWVAYITERTGRVYAHSPEQVAGWAAFAGLKLRGMTHVGPVDQRGGLQARGPVLDRPAARVIGAVALVL